MKNNKKKNILPIESKTAKNAIEIFNRHVDEHSSFTIDYTRWYVGVTNNPLSRKNAHKSILGHEIFFWKHFYCKSKLIALAVEKFFHDKGMLEKDLQGGTASNTYYVYVYKKYPTILD